MIIILSINADVGSSAVVGSVLGLSIFKYIHIKKEVISDLLIIYNYPPKGRSMVLDIYTETGSVEVYI